MPEILVTMLIGGILLLFLFDGIDMIRTIVGQSHEAENRPDINRLEKYEMLKEKSDSLAIDDSIRFFSRGEEIGKCAKWD